MAAVMHVHPVMATELSIDDSPSADTSQSDDLSTDAQSPASMSHPNSMNIRRPPRKSTLTQQQKNQKRQRATQEQLNTLEIEFNKNPTPSAVVRERIASDINMTERSVQIWFQNRRAKIKNLAKKSIETGEDCDAIPESMRKYLAMQAMESGKPLVRDLHSRGNGPFGGSGLIMNAESQAKVLISHLACRSLRIGTWQRMSQTALDLVVFYSPAKSVFTYYINADSSGFKIEYPFSAIKNISLDSSDTSNNADGSTHGSGGLIVELTHPPQFSMDPGSGGFFTCRDFTEDQQASKVMTHHLGGHSKVLAGQLAKLVSLEQFRNRHQIVNTNTIAMSAPVSPVGLRPSSQPNHLLHPHAVNGFRRDGFNMAPPPSRLGHKRQRSRSVPVAVDMSQFRRPMAPFPHQEMPQMSQMTTQQTMFQQPNFQNHIFAPLPQHGQIMQGQNMQNHSMPHTPNGFAPIGSSLSINTAAAGFDFDFIRAGPMSATTVNSSEMEPTFFTTGPPSDTYSTTPSLQTPYGATFYSPMINQTQAPHSHAPMSPFIGFNAGGPIIANQSPPLSNYDRGVSNEIFVEHQDPSTYQENTFDFQTMYAKPQYTLPFRSPVMETPPEPEFDFQNMVNFNSADSASVSPDQNRFTNGNKGN